MALPTVTQTWSFSINNRHTFDTVLATMQDFAFKFKGFLKTTLGLTVKGSCTAGTGAMDATDRWTVLTDVTPQGANAASSQAWFVLTDANGADFLLAFQGASNDIFKFSMSPGGLFVAAGTPANQPTATDECSIVSATTIVNATASADRLYHFLGTTDKKMFRAIVHRSGAGISMVGQERFTTAVVSPTTCSPAVWGFFYNVFTFGGGANTIMGAGSTTGGGIARVHAAQDLNITIGGGGKVFGAIGGTTGTFFGVEKADLQGGNGELILPVTLTSATASGQGKLGKRFDWWAALSNASGTPVQGDMFGTNQFAAVGAHVMPWDGANAMTVT